jgi:predicted acyltransferase
MEQSSQQKRLLSLDVFRGLTIAGMVLVNNPGTWSAIYSPLEHAPWHGITPTDYIFPFFLFIVGVAIAIALGKRLNDENKAKIYRKIFFRSASIFATGLAISALPLFYIGETDIPWPLKWMAAVAMFAALLFLFLRKFMIAAILVGVWLVIVVGFYFAGYTITPYNIATMRIPGVLQRIAVCYLIASVIFLNTNWKQQTAISIGLLLLYWALMTLVPVPGCEVTTINDKACNLAAYLDRTILTEPHMWRAAKVFDPEGILSTMTAVVTTLSGVLTGTWLKSERPEIEKAGGMFFFGTILLAAGWSWSLLFPLNKSLWTSSYVLYTSGLALLTLSCCYWLIDIKGWKKWSKPFVIFGVNALALFTFSGIMARVLGIIKIPAADGTEISLQGWIFKNAFLRFAEPINASLAYAICFILFWLLLMWLLWRRRIFIKV